MVGVLNREELHSSVKKLFAPISTPWIYPFSHGRVLELLTPFTTKIFFIGDSAQRGGVFLSRITTAVAAQ